MLEGFDSTENIPVTEAEVISMLDRGGIEDPEVKALLVKYQEQCEAEANRKAESGSDPALANRANIEAAIIMARLYSKTKMYRDYALESLEEALWSAKHDPSTEDLQIEIEKLIDSLI